MLWGGSGQKKEVADATSPNIQSLPLPRAGMNIDPIRGKGGGDVRVVDGSALLPDEGPSGTIADIIVRPANPTISRYQVQPDDTLSDIAVLFGVDENTILWANDLPRGATIHPGQVLTILPVTGLRHTVEKGDTLATVAEEYNADAAEIASYNGLDSSASLAAGTEIIIPDGVIALAPAAPEPQPSASTPRPSVSSAGSSDAGGYYLRPIDGGVRTQGIHGYNGVDLAASAGTPILASASGEVIVSREGGWNGGYGNYVVIQHANGTQTLYAHNSSNIVGVGQYVVQGQVIGYVGTTGRSTGSHVHFEIRGGPRNPF
jgi:murein DD-endopeptidase MepM/ murein hydrolase activator NlpD